MKKPDEDQPIAVASPPEGQQIEHVKLSYAEARQITDEIRGAVENVWTLLKKAHDGQAWQSLGYPSWDEYVKQEFQMSRRHANRLINYAELQDTLKSEVGPNGLTPTEWQARPIIEKLKEPEQQREAWSAAVEASGGKPTAKHVEAAVVSVQSRIRPIEPITLTPEQERTVEEAEKDSERLWLLKSYWKKTTKQERAQFWLWAKHLNDAKPDPEGKGDYRPSDAFQYADMALIQLDKIHRNDTQREDAFQRIVEWIAAASATTRKERPKRGSFDDWMRIQDICDHVKSEVQELSKLRANQQFHSRCNDLYASIAKQLQSLIRADD